MEAIEALKSQLHNFQNNEQKHWRDLKKVLDARAVLTKNEEMLVDLIEQFCTLSNDEQQQIEDSGDNSTAECYNSLYDHLSVKRRVPLLGEHLYDSNDQETEILRY